MPPSNPVRDGTVARIPSVVTLLMVLLGVPGLSPAWEVQIEGFTEPYRTIDVAAAETGVITAIAVREGETVRQGQTLATLDMEVFLATLQIAKLSMEARGKLGAAQAELELRKRRFEKLQALRAEAHASEQELERAQRDLAVAQAEVEAATEELQIRKLEYERIQAQIERRTVRAPSDGVITSIYKEPGEFVAPNDPRVLTIVQLDPLLATFSVPAHRAGQLSTGKQVAVRFPESGKTVQAAVELVAPVTDAQSGTVRVKVRIDNPKGLHRSGSRCTLELPGSPLRPGAPSRQSPR